MIHQRFDITKLCITTMSSSTSCLLHSSMLVRWKHYCASYEEIVDYGNHSHRAWCHCRTWLGAALKLAVLSCLLRGQTLFRGFTDHIEAVPTSAAAQDLSVCFISDPRKNDYAKGGWEMFQYLLVDCCDVHSTALRASLWVTI